MTNKDTLYLWKQVEHTPEEHLKQVDMRGGFTAIDPQWQLKVATELWGPYGSAWGLNKLKFTMLELNGPPAMMLQATFFYPVPSIAGTGIFEMAVDMPYRLNDDCCKKLITSARSKALSCLGFSADVFMDKFSDHHYVQMNKIRFADTDHARTSMLAAIRLAPDIRTLAVKRSKVTEMIADDVVDGALGRELMAAIEMRETELNEPS